jgi:hypothetical protein
MKATILTCAIEIRLLGFGLAEDFTGAGTLLKRAMCVPAGTLAAPGGRFKTRFFGS